MYTFLSSIFFSLPGDLQIQSSAFLNIIAQFFPLSALFIAITTWQTIFFFVVILIFFVVNLKLFPGSCFNFKKIHGSLN
jgi:hypothetical protein